MRTNPVVWRDENHRNAYFHLCGGVLREVRFRPEVENDGDYTEYYIGSAVNFGLALLADIAWRLGSDTDGDGLALPPGSAFLPRQTWPQFGHKTGTTTLGYL